MNGLTETGFEVNSLTQNILDYQTSLRVAYNNPKLSIEDNEKLGQLIKLIADRETKVWQALQQIFQVWSLNGAESVFLDELMALNGIFRKGATSGVGLAVVQVDRTSTDTTEVSVGSVFNAENGISYATSSSQLISSKVTAWRVNCANASIGTYNLNIRNNTTSQIFTTPVTLANNSPSARLIFLNNIKNFIQSVNPDEENLHSDESNLILYWGFDSAFELKGLEQDVRLLSTPILGNRYGLIEVVATTTGFYPLGIGQISTLSPLPQGYVSVTNLTQFSDGTNVETDAAFIERARTITNSPRSSTRSAIVAGLLSRVEGIQRVRIDKSVIEGKVEVTPVIIGGSTEDIARELERTQTVTNVYSGTESFEVETSDGSVEEIRFSRGVSQQLNVKVTYSTINNTPLSDSETAEIVRSLVNEAEKWDLGKKIFNFSLLSAVSSSVVSGRFSSILVQVKKVQEPTSSFSSSDYTPLVSELPDLIESNITFERVL